MTPEESKKHIEEHAKIWNPINSRREIINKLLHSTKRDGIDKLIIYLNNTDFYTIPASSRFHNTEKGGLAKHSLKVHDLFKTHLLTLTDDFEKEIPKDSVIICSLLHDLCKITPKTESHAAKTLIRIRRYIKLTNLEKEIITYHMGYYHCKNFNKWMDGEYTIQELSMAQNNPIVKLFHWCDDMDAQFTGKKD